jgi:hypothetical protein
MQVFELSVVPATVTDGMPADLFTNKDALDVSGRILEADYELTMPTVFHKCAVDCGMRKGDPLVLLLGQAFLTRIDPAKTKSRILIAVDLGNYAPDKNLGDESVLVDFAGDYGLYVCTKWHTFFRCLSTDEVVLWGTSAKPCVISDKDAAAMLEYHRRDKLIRAANRTTGRTYKDLF